MKNVLLNEELRKILILLDKGVLLLEYSLEKCNKITILEEMNADELESFESLTSRYARLSDIFTQKLLKTLFLLLREEAKTFIDKANLCEKIELVDSAQLLLDIRDLRNDIAHEYILEDISVIFNKTLNLSDELIKIIKNSKYIIDRLLNN